MLSYESSILSAGEPGYGKELCVPSRGTQPRGWVNVTWW